MLRRVVRTIAVRPLIILTAYLATELQKFHKLLHDRILRQSDPSRDMCSTQRDTLKEVLASIPGICAPFHSTAKGKAGSNGFMQY